MTLIPDCIREILLTIEEKGVNYGTLDIRDFKYSEYDDDTVIYHLKLLLDEPAYITGKISEFNNVWIERMTMSGHKFLDTIRDGIVWEETKRTANSTFKSVSIVMLYSVDMNQAKSLAQRKMQRICTAARKESIFLAYLVATPRQPLRCRKAFSTKCRSLYRYSSYSRCSMRFFLGGMTTCIPRSSA